MIPPGPDDRAVSEAHMQHSRNLAPIRDRTMSSPSPMDVPELVEKHETSPIVQHPPSEKHGPSPSVQHPPSKPSRPTLSIANDNLVLKVEHMDTAINAHASVIAEGIRPRLERKNSAMDGLKALFRSSQVGFPTLEEMMGNDVIPFTRVSAIPPEEVSLRVGSMRRASIQVDQPLREPQTSSGSLSRMPAVLSGRLKVHPQEESPPSRKKSAGPSIQEPPAEPAPLPMAEPVKEAPDTPVAVETKKTPPVIPPVIPKRRSGSEAKDTPLTKRPSNLSAVAESAYSLTRKTSKMVDKTLMESLDETRQAKVAELMEKDVMVLNENQLAKMQQRSAHPFTISVESAFRRWWDLIIALCTAYVIITMPIKVGFDVQSEGLAFVIDAIVDLLYAFEIPLNMFTSYFDEATGEEVKPLKSIRHNYIYGYFALDAMSCFPVSLLDHGHPLLLLSKTIKIARVYKLSKSGFFKAFSARVNRSMNPSMLRMLELTFIFFFSQHFIACTYYFISLNQRQATSWQVPEDTRDSTLVRQYIHAFYFAIMVTTANDVNPTTTTEKLFTSVMLFVGIVINASIIGSAANLLSNLDKAEIARKNQMDSINDYMRFKKVPLKLQEKIRRYYEYALNGRITDQTETLFAELPGRLKLSLRLSLHDDFIRKVPLFHVCSNAGVIAIIQCLRPVVAMPHEVIISQGEMASEFYFIKNGRVSLCVRLKTEEVPLGNLGEGSFFGESSLLTDEPQLAEVKSESITELAYLTKGDFLAIIKKFPTFHLAVRRISDNRMQTAHNVQRMTKMQRRQSNPHVQSMGRRSTLKKAAEAILQSASLRGSLSAAVRPLSGSRRFSDRFFNTGFSTPEPPHAVSPDGSFVHLSQRFSSSRRNSTSGLFSASYMDRISLGQARHLATLQSLDGLEIENAADDPLWN